MLRTSCTSLYCAICSSVVAARADWLRRNLTAANVKEALRLDPLNADGYTLRAQLPEQEDQFGEADIPSRRPSLALIDRGTPSQ